MAGEKILIVEDDLDICEVITLYLHKSGYQIQSTGNGLEAIRILNSFCPELIILDIQLPGLDGYELCQERRKMTNVPIMFLSVKQDEIDKILALGVGGDDYLSKPFSPGELIARIKAHLRRSRMHSPSNIANSRNGGADGEAAERTLTYPGLAIDMERHRVTVRDQEVALSMKEFKILSLLAKNPGKIFSIEEIFAQIWGTNSLGDYRTVMVHISNLRKKIERDPLKPIYILNLRGMGYKFNEAIGRH